MIKLNFKKVFLFCSVVLCCNIGQAQTQTEKIEISLEKALEIALDNNPTIKVANIEITRQEYVLKETKANLIPTVDASLGYNHNVLLPIMFMPAGILGDGGPITVGMKNSINGMVSMALPIYMPTIYRSIALSREQLSLTIEQARASRIDMTKQVKDAYYNILLTESSLSVLRLNEQMLKDVVADVEKKFKQGVASEYDLLTAKVQLKNLDPVIIRAKSGLQIANYMFKVLLSLPQDINIVLTEDFDVLKKNTLEPTRLNIDLSNNTQIRQIDYQTNILNENYRISRANRIPSISAFMNYSAQSQSDNFNLRWAHSSVAGLQVNIPIFKGMKNRYKDIQIKNNIDQVNLNRNYLEANLRTQAASIISTIESANAQIESNVLAIEEAKKAFTISTTRYNVGMGTILELNNAQVALMQAELSMNQAYFDLLTAISDYEKLMGATK